MLVKFKSSLSLSVGFTNHDKRDSHLRSPDFLNAKEYPKMIFKADTNDLKLNPVALEPRGEATPIKRFGFSHDFEKEW